jgi:hypothetical protein
MGMGLSICRTIIESHNGRIWVAPNKPQGAVFQFVLLAAGATSAGGASGGKQPDDSHLVRASDADAQSELGERPIM